MKPIKKLQGNGRRILVVDDDLAIRVLLDTVLRRMGFSVMLASDGQQALDLLERYEYDLILLDLLMPIVNGHEVLARLDPKARTPIVVFTAVMHEDEFEHDRVCSSIRKPFDLEVFVDTIAECLAQEPGSDEGSESVPAADAGA